MRKIIVLIVVAAFMLGFVTSASADLINTTGPSGSFYIYAQTTMSGGDVGSFGDRIYLNTGSRIEVHTVSISDLGLADQHPSNPEATGAMLPRTFTYEPTLSFNLPSGITAGMGNSELYIDATGIYQAVGPAYSSGGSVVRYDPIGGGGGGSTYTTIINSSTVANGHGTSFLARDPVSGTFYSGNEYNTDGTVNSTDLSKRRAVYGWDGSAWVEEFTYRSHGYTGMSHMDGLAYVRDTDGTGYMYVSDMTTDYLGQWTYDPTADGGAGAWVETNLFNYTDGSSRYVEGMDFGALGHFWASSALGGSGAVIEIGGGDLGGYIPPVIPAPGAFLLGSIGLCITNWRLRRRNEC